MEKVTLNIKSPNSFSKQPFLKGYLDKIVFSFLIFLLSSASSPTWSPYQNANFENWTWEEVNDNAQWAARAGLQVVNHRRNFYLMGGRTPINPAVLPFPVPGASTIWGDVWKSTNKGENWNMIFESDNETDWPARAYFQAVSNGRYMYILGGQNFNIVQNMGDPNLPPFYSQSDFFNDVWRSENGTQWERMTEHAPWSERAGLSAAYFKGHIYVMGGSVNDDSSITPQGPARIYYNDVWKSRNGRDWTRLTEHAEWAPRAGGIAVVKHGYIYMIGGEDGFICNEQTPRCPPYYNDVWRSRNGKDWELVVEEAEWTARPGHQVVVANNKFVLFGGFGLGFDITVPANPMDIWVSSNGEVWEQVSDSPWNSGSPADIKYDFDAIAIRGGSKVPTAIYTFGGDRETFNFADPFNYQNVDNDVWKFSLPGPNNSRTQQSNDLVIHRSYPNPFFQSTKIIYETNRNGKAIINIYDLNGYLIKSLESQNKTVGIHEVVWNGLDEKGNRVDQGIYIAKIRFEGMSQFIKLISK